MTPAELVYQHLQQLPESLVAEVFEFVQFLEYKQARITSNQPREMGSARGQIWIADDFDEPLDEFNDYRGGVEGKKSLGTIHLSQEGVVK